MDPQNQGSQYGPPSGGPGYPPPAYAQERPVAGGQPDIAKRAIAAIIDFAIIGFVVGILNVVLGIALGRFGLAAAALGGTAAMLLRDVALQGRSLGKKVMGLNVVNAAGGPITAQQSIRRNSTLAIGMAGQVFGVIPFIGWLIGLAFSIAGLAAAVYEIYLVATNKPRYGDQLAGTHVVLDGQAAIAV